MMQQTAVTQPNSIQLQVQITNEQEDIVDDEELDLPQEDIEKEETPPPEKIPTRNWLPLIGFCIIFFLFLLPFIISLLNYWSDYNLLLFINETSSNLVNARNNILNSNNNNISILICDYNDSNSVSDSDLLHFRNYLMQNYSELYSDYCECSFIQLSNCSNNEYRTTSNFDVNKCESITNQCYLCNNCINNNIYLNYDNNPYYLYSDYLYNNLKDKDSYCSPSIMNDNIINNNISSYYTHCYNACIAFLILSAIWLLSTIYSGFKLRLIDLKRSYLICIKSPNQKREYNNINRDEFTIYVVCIIFLHLFEDVPQCIIAIMFSIYKQMNGGTDCIINFESNNYENDVNLIPLNPDSYSSAIIANIMFNDRIIAIFFLFSFVNVFLTGLYGIRLFKFDIQNILSYSWYKNVIYFLCGIFLGVFCCLLILAPFWGCIWLSKDYLDLTEGQSAFIGWTSVSGLICYCVAFCLPLCFADQLDCDCECGDGCC